MRNGLPVMKNCSCIIIFMLFTYVVATPGWAGTRPIQRSVVYSRVDGVRMRMTLTMPRDTGEGPRPMVLLIHGGAWCTGTRHQVHWYACRFAEQGYVAASISYRMMPRHPFPACLHDCKAAVRWLRLHAEEYRTDPDRIVALGKSAGGHLAALLATTGPQQGFEGTECPGPSSAIEAAILLYGVMDMSYYRDPRGWIRMGGLASRYMRAFVGQPSSSTPDPFQAASPVTYVSPNTPPTLLAHGLRDGLVPYGQSVDFRERLRQCGVPARLVTVPYGHAFDAFHPKARKVLFDEIMTFLNENLAKRGA